MNLQATPLAAAALACEHEHLIVPDVDELLGHHPVLVENFPQLRHVAADAFVPVVRRGEVGKLARTDPHDLGVEGFEWELPASGDLPR